uniref:Uncharacterized protein n=1 Tax=Meloidogyne enterolobii TaxID=390850 RepID=A0A6V7W8W8_MELEN|nr:unnamed protein product [Meloidogyne enterolobii]
MGELFKNKLEFLEWYIGFELTDLLHNSGFDKIKKLDNCDNKKLFEATSPDLQKSLKSNFKNKFNKNKNEFPPTFSKRFKNINLSDISEENKEKYKKSNIRIYQDFIINFNRRKRIPNWVLEYLTKEHMNNLTGEKFWWSDDPNFSKIFQPQYADYECHPNSIHNHGHLATGNLHPHEQGFYLTNSVPQLDKVNRGHWRVIEEYISCMAKKAEETYIYSGPLFLPNQEKNLMEFQVIGPKEISVPTHLFKIVILKIFDNSEWKYWLESYVMTNTDLDELFDVKNEKTNPFKHDGSPEIVHNCRKKEHFLEYVDDKEKYTGNNFPRYIVDLLKYYRKPYKFIEENSDFRLLTLLSEKIKGVKDGVLFDMEIERAEDKGDGEEEINSGNVKEEISIDKTSDLTESKNGGLPKNIVELSQNKAGKRKGKAKGKAKEKGMEKIEDDQMKDNQQEVVSENKKDDSMDLVQKKLESGNKSETAQLNKINESNIGSLPKEQEWQEIKRKKNKKGKKQNKKIIFEERIEELIESTKDSDATNYSTSVDDDKMNKIINPEIKKTKSASEDEKKKETIPKLNKNKTKQKSKNKDKQKAKVKDTDLEFLNNEIKQKNKQINIEAEKKKKRIKKLKK